MTAQDITAPVSAVELGGRNRALQFDHEQIRQTELCWQRVTGNVMGYLGILRQADMGVYTALFAVCYGALISAQKSEGTAARELTSLAEFDGMAECQALLDMGAELVASAIAALPKADRSKKA